MKKNHHKFVQTLNIEFIILFASPIYCQGDLLDIIQRMRLFNDSKTFVDMSLKQSPGSDTKSSFCFMLKKNFQQPKYKLLCPSISEEVLSAFNNLSKPISEAQGRKFVGDHFSGPGDEFQPWKPTDLPRMYVFIKSCACLFLINCNSKCFVINRKSCKYTNFFTCTS